MATRSLSPKAAESPWATLKSPTLPSPMETRTSTPFLKESGAEWNRRPDSRFGLPTRTFVSTSEAICSRLIAIGLPGISMTVNLGTSGDEPWPIWIAGPQGIASVSLNPGDGLIYRGCDCYHWREPFHGTHLAQVFLHYVDQNGPNAEWKYDKRPRLSTPSDENQSVRSPQGIVVVDDFLRPSTFAELSQCISNKPLLYGSRSNSRTDPHGHWSWNFVTAGPLNLSDVSGDLEENEEAGPVHSAWRFLRDTRLEKDAS